MYDNQGFLVSVGYQNRGILLVMFLPEGNQGIAMQEMNP